MRNLWAIMKEFNTLPTDERFRSLSDPQIDLILHSMKEDHREMELARKGLTVDSSHYDTSFDEEVWNRETGQWEVLKDGHDPNDIAKQIEELTQAEDRKNLASKFDSLDELNAFLEAGGQTPRDSEIDQYINKQLAAAEEKARQLAATGKNKLVDDKDRPEATSALSDSLPDIDKEAIDRSIALFNSENPDDDDDEYSML